MPGTRGVLQCDGWRFPGDGPHESSRSGCVGFEPYRPEVVSCGQAHVGVQGGGQAPQQADSGLGTACFDAFCARTARSICLWSRCLVLRNTVSSTIVPSAVHQYVILAEHHAAGSAVPRPVRPGDRTTARRVRCLSRRACRRPRRPALSLLCDAPGSCGSRHGMMTFIIVLCRQIPHGDWIDPGRCRADLRAVNRALAVGFRQRSACAR